MFGVTKGGRVLRCGRAGWFGSGSVVDLRGGSGHSRKSSYAVPGNPFGQSRRGSIIGNGFLLLMQPTVLDVYLS